MRKYRYILEPYQGVGTRFNCPQCGKKKTYTRYIDSDAGSYLPFEYGKCNREIKCGYHQNPYKENLREVNQDGAYIEEKPLLGFSEVPGNHSPSHHPFELVQKSLSQYDHNAFVKFLCSRFGYSITANLIREYLIGTSKKYRNTGNGAVVFWNIDINGKVRNGKIMGYDPKSGKRIKEPFQLQNWVHSVMKLHDFNLSHCFYGEHLLKKYPHKDVAIVESEKTAIISSMYLPQFVWLASGNLNGINEEKAQALKGRNVQLFPDLSVDGKACKKWEVQASRIKRLTKSININTLLERLAPVEHRLNGYDLGDYFTSIKLEEWVNLEVHRQYRFDPVSKVYINEHGYPASWDFQEEPAARKITNMEKLSINNPLLNDLVNKFALIEI